jgi:hypothetical protein
VREVADAVSASAAIMPMAQQRPKRRRLDPVACLYLALAVAGFLVALALALRSD